MLSKLLCGYFIGGEFVLTLAYFAESSIDYRQAKLKLGKESETSDIIRNNLFVAKSVGTNVGYFLGPGMLIS